MEPLEECDLVMKGGITSGVVYPPAVLRLKDRYRFRNVGGASVGAIAAVVTAAAEYGRQKGTGGFTHLDAISRELPQPGFMQGLFQPKPELRGLYSVILASTTTKPTKWPKIAGRILRAEPATSLLLIVAWIAAVGYTLNAGAWPWLLLADALWTAAILPLVIAALRGRARLLMIPAVPLGFLLWPLLPIAAWMLWSAYRELAKPGFGICTGMPQGDSGESALTTWLHEKIQGSAGLREPLTFRHLEGVGVRLEVTSTDLSHARPLSVPTSMRDYMFRLADLQPLFPEDVLGHLAAVSDPLLTVEESDFRILRDVRDLPVLVAFRLSMSFPILFTAVPMYAFVPADDQGDQEPAVAWLSDGGIGSNFPIHFFDSWFPSRPTFGLSLGPYPETTSGKRRPGASTDMSTSPTAPVEPRCVLIKNVFQFGHQILDTMENWRDTMQSELPGFRDRICQIRLEKDEGGMNIGMEKSAIDSLIAKGDDAGRALVDDFRWDQHRFTRYVILMQALQRRFLGGGDPLRETRVTGLRQSFPEYGARLAAGDTGEIFRWNRDDGWCRAAEQQTNALLHVASQWAEEPDGDARPGTNLFDGGDSPRPRSVMRIVPPV